MAMAALKVTERFDADENIMVIVAHDWALLDVIDFWPKPANGWYNAKWKERSQWKTFKGSRQSYQRRSTIMDVVIIMLNYCSTLRPFDNDHLILRPAAVQHSQKPYKVSRKGESCA
jgi:hypothetical protein